jgi:phosphate uptake regulator
MNARKLVKSGYSSLVVAVPKEWVEKNKLKHGDHVFIDEENNNLIIKKEYKEKQNDRRDKLIDIDGRSDRVIYREIASAYLNDYQHVTIRGKSLRDRVKNIKTMISEMIALEVVDESSEKIVAKNFLNIYDTDINLLIRRMDNIVRSMILDAKEAIKDASLVENIIERDKEVNKSNYLISKILKTALNDKDILYKLGIKERDILKYWEINNALEKIGDRIKHIARFIMEINPGCKKRLSDLLSHIEEFYVASMTAFYKESVKMSDDICGQKEAIGQEIHEFASHKCITCSKIAINAFNMNGHINDIGRAVRYLTSYD